MTYEKADNQTYESKSPQRDRHVDVQRSLCRKVERTAGQGRTHHTGTRRENGNTTFDDSSVGSWEKPPVSRKISRDCKSSENNPPKLTPERVDFGENLENFGKIFFAETLQNTESSGFSEKILGNFAHPPIAITQNVCYNKGIMVGESPIKNGSLKYWSTSTSLTANLNQLDSLLTLNYTRLVYLTSGSSQPEGRKGEP